MRLPCPAFVPRRQVPAHRGLPAGLRLSETEGTGHTVGAQYTWVALMPLLLRGDPSLAVSVLVAVTDSPSASREWAVSRENLTA